MTEEQVVDADLDDIELATDSDDDETDRGSSTATEAAPQCAGCHRRGIGLTLLENGKRYCERCAQEVERLMGIGPLFPSAAELAEAHEHDHSPTEDSDSEVPTEAPVAELAEPTDEDSEADQEADEVPEGPLAESAAEVSEEAEEPAFYAAEPEVAASVVVPDADTPPIEVPDTPELPAEPVASEETSEPSADAVTEERSVADLKQLIADTNHEAANSNSSLIPRPTTRMSADEAEETEPMERVETQARPVPLNDASPNSGPPPTDLQGVLGAERSRLLDQRAAIEARFRADVEAIDERLVHVESLLGDERQSLAS